MPKRDVKADDMNPMIEELMQLKYARTCNKANFGEKKVELARMNSK